MSLIALIQRITSYTAFQQAQGDDSFPGTQIDADLDQTNNAVNALAAKVSAVVRADGKIANGSVTRSALAADLLVGVGAARPWDSTALYLEDDTVTRGYSVWQAVIGNAGIDPATDDGTNWTLVADLSQAVTIAAGGIGANALADDAVTRRAIGLGAVGTDEIADQVVTRAKVALNFGLMPIGATMNYAGFVPPTGWLFAAGQAVSRTTYADLFNTITLVLNGQSTIGNQVILLGNVDVSGFGLRGAVVEGPGIPDGTTIANAIPGSLILSNAATSTTAAPFRIMPYGRGDGSTTFQVPDHRGRATFGRDDMGGGGAGRLVQLFDGANLSVSALYGSGGRERATLTLANLPATLPGGQVTVSYPPYQYETRAQLIAASSGAGGTPVGDVWQGVAGKGTVAPDPQTFGTGNIANPGGGTSFPIVPPAAVANVIIFAGA